MLNHPWRTYCLWWTEEPLLSFCMGHNEPMTLEALLGVFSDCTIQIVTQLYQMLTAVKHYGRLEILKEKNQEFPEPWCTRHEAPPLLLLHPYCLSSVTAVYRDSFLFSFSRLTC